MFTTLLSSALLAGALSTGVQAAPVDERWFQARDSSVSALFEKRQTSPSDPNFAAAYPPGWATPPADRLPKAWTDKLASIQLPDVPVSNPNNGYPTYSNGKAGSDPSICSFTYECTVEDDLHIPPDGVWALTFDDGVGPASSKLYDFLEANNASTLATHFMIGGNILSNPTLMQRCATSGGHIAVHTWSHQYMTSMSNEDVLSELGWTMQIIADLNGGRIPRFWRPPFGDVDNRVRAIAKGVFGLETVVWNQDSGDWAIGADPNYTHESVLATMTGWFEGSKSPGINSLEHEIKDTEVDAFIAAFPVGKSNGWNIMSIPDAFNQPWYSNSEGNSAPVTTRSIGEGTFTGSGAMTMTAEDKASANATTSTSSMSASASASASGSGSSASASASLTSASSASSAAQNGNGAASSGAANAQTSQPSNGATSLVIGTSSLWAIVAMISALVL